MIYSPGRQYIFVHAPKTGGTSLALMLEDRAMKDDILIGDTPKAQKRRGRVKDVQTTGRLWKHSMLTDLYGLIPQEHMETFFVFSLVRNPWDRLVSYYHWLGAQSFDHPAVTAAKVMAFPDFLRNPIVIKAISANPYTRYVTDQNGVMQADHFIRLEHLEEDLAPLEAHLDLKFKAVAHANASTRDQDYRKYYDSDLVDHIAEACAADIAQFEYRFE